MEGEREQELADGRYVAYLDRELGSGAFGEVWEGYDRHFEQAVAIKLFPEDFELDAVLLEAALQRRVSNHPHVVDIFDVVAEPPRPFVVTALCPAGSVQGQLDVGPVSFKDAMQWTRDVLAGLAHAHGEGVIHRDVKPSNLLVMEGRRAALTDFGLAEDTLLDRLASNLMYEEHVAPELHDGAPSSRQTDVFAAGCTAYRLLTGQSPYEDHDSRQLAQPVHDLNPQVPMAVSKAISTALAIDPADRYPDAARMQGAIAELRIHTTWTPFEEDGVLEAWRCQLRDGEYFVRLANRPRLGFELTAHRDKGKKPRRVQRESFQTEGRARQRLRTWLRAAVERGALP